MLNLPRTRRAIRKLCGLHMTNCPFYVQHTHYTNRLLKKNLNSENDCHLQF